MKEWFSVEEIDEETFVISEYTHWEETHCYLVCGSEKAVLIDTGLGVANIKEIVDQLTTLPVEVVTTHVHWDRIGGHKYFDEIAVHEAEEQWLSIQFPLPLHVVKNNLVCQPCHFPTHFHIDDYQVFQGPAQRILHDNDCLNLGNRQIIVIHTPGHSPGHCCFYEPNKKYIFTGDLIYRGCLDVFYPTTDSQQFLQSIRRVQQIDIAQLFPGHHELHIPVNMVDDIEHAFHSLEKENKLIQGSGIFDFGDFQIHV